MIRCVTLCLGSGGEGVSPDDGAGGDKDACCE